MGRYTIYREHERPLNESKTLGYLAIGALIGTLFYASMYFGILKADFSHKNNTQINNRINKNSLDTRDLQR